MVGSPTKQYNSGREIPAMSISQHERPRFERVVPDRQSPTKSSNPQRISPRLDDRRVYTLSPTAAISSSTVQVRYSYGPPAAVSPGLLGWNELRIGTHQTTEFLLPQDLTATTTTFDGYSMTQPAFSQGLIYPRNSFESSIPVSNSGLQNAFEAGYIPSTLSGISGDLHYRRLSIDFSSHNPRSDGSSPPQTDPRVSTTPPTTLSEESLFNTLNFDAFDGLTAEDLSSLGNAFHLSPKNVSDAVEPSVLAIAFRPSNVEPSTDGKSSQRQSPPSSDESWVVPTPPSNHSGQTTSPRPKSPIQTVAETLANAAVVQGPCSKIWTIPPKRKSQKRTQNTNIDQTSNVDRVSKSVMPKRRGKFKNEEKRAGTARTRKLHACMRCRFMRIRCEEDPEDPHGACSKCKTLTRPTFSNLPCLRWIITDVFLYREQAAPYELFSKRWKSMDLVDITVWASKEIRTIEVTQNFLHAPYKVDVREFVPIEGDMLEERWTDGAIIKTHVIPPYGVVDMKKTAEDLWHFVDENVANYFVNWVGDKDPLLWHTYWMAYKHSEDSDVPEEKRMLQACMRLWVACRLTSFPEHICGGDKLGLNNVEDSTSPWFHHIPIPPVMGAQLECIIYTKLLKPLNKSVLDLLQALVTANRRKHWFSIYLAKFILLHNCAIFTRRDWEYARQISLKSEYANTTSIQAHHAGALTLLAHFHFANKGKHPFKLALSPKGIEEVTEFGGLNETETQFVKDTATLVNRRADEMKGIRDSRQFGNDLYWVSQLYEENWEPGPTA